MTVKEIFMHTGVSMTAKGIKYVETAIILLKEDFVFLARAGDD